MEDYSTEGREVSNNRNKNRHKIRQDCLFSQSILPIHVFQYA